ncbi:MAG: DUF3221 domain-containing protein [Actinomycetota bacterium]
MKILRFLALVSALMLFSGCQTTSMKADIRGYIASINFAQVANEAEAIVLIEGSIEEDTLYDRASVSITAQTRILRNVGGKIQNAGIGELEQGQRVQAAFTGPVMETYPVQAEAKEIVILE